MPKFWQNLIDQTGTQLCPLMNHNLQLIALIKDDLLKHQTCERSIPISLGRQNYASAFTAKISALCAPSHCIQIGVLKCGCGREGQHLSFLWTYVKHHTYCQFWRDPAF